jgi:hypothetical protein
MKLQGQSPKAVSLETVAGKGNARRLNQSEGLINLVIQK